jgi:O-antigen/teichoic acid export membrane protein
MSEKIVRDKNKQLAINMTASIVSFLVNFGINFFLTPFIVSSLGAAAYGFIGLSTNIISYTQLITIALNSMAGRFISIKYIEGDINSANRYFSSVLYSNVILSLVILVVNIFIVFYIDSLFDVPSNLLLDVQLLFSFVALNTIFGLLSNVYAIATFIKNRLELTSLRTIVANIIRAAILVVGFSLFQPKLWYMGLAGLMATIYSYITNISLTKRLTPDLIINRSYIDYNKIKELILSGLWNTFSKVGDLLAQGLDLLFINIFIGAAAMGIFSLTKNVPLLIQQLFVLVAAVFAPIFTKLYAENKKSDLLNELDKSIRILGFVTGLLLPCLFVYGDTFYKLWLPMENATELQTLTIIGNVVLVFAMPLEPLWSIFTLTNKLKYSTIVLFVTNILIFATVLISLIYVESAYVKLLILAGSRSIWGALRTILFLPIYGSYCLDLKYSTFYPSMMKSVLSFCLTLLVGIFLKQLFSSNTWLELFGHCISLSIISLIIGFFMILRNEDRVLLKNFILRYKKR